PTADRLPILPPPLPPSDDSPFTTDAGDLRQAAELAVALDDRPRLDDEITGNDAPTGPGGEEITPFPDAEPPGRMPRADSTTPVTAIAPKPQPHPEPTA